MAILILGAVSTLALNGCVQIQGGPTHIYSRLPPGQSGMGAHPLTAKEKQRYDDIARQVRAERQQTMRLNAQARALARASYYAPVGIYGGYYGGWGRRGWGGWGIGVGGWGW